jgi:hypothetical protein
MGFTPLSVIANPTPDQNEVLVAGVNAEGIPQNVLLRNTPALRAQLAATPATIPNPEHAALRAEHASATATVAGLVAEIEAAPPEDPNRANLVQQLETAQSTAMALSEQVAATPPTVPNPDRAPIEQRAFEAAVRVIDGATEAATAPSSE